MGYNLDYREDLNGELREIEFFFFFFFLYFLLGQLFELEIDKTFLRDF